MTSGKEYKETKEEYQFALKMFSFGVGILVGGLVTGIVTYFVLLSKGVIR